VPVPENTGYTLFFPIELTNKDYLRRVFDIVATGIQGSVKRMIGKHGARLGPIGSQKKKGGKAEYDFNKTCDLYYLAKHIADDASAPVYAQGLQPFHVQRNRTYSRRTPLHSACALYSCFILFLQNSKPTSANLWMRARH